ncbi:hypothetical protein [Stenotrophomonas sp.]|uniref:hypothetical protein n=1 Tax=Stenotrophomonas sp. TaxID=69392 RepID=UPI002FCC1025
MRTEKPGRAGRWPASHTPPCSRGPPTNSQWQVRRRLRRPTITGTGTGHRAGRLAHVRVRCRHRYPHVTENGRAVASCARFAALMHPRWAGRGVGHERASGDRIARRPMPSAVRSAVPGEDNVVVETARKFAHLCNSDGKTRSKM